MFYIIIYYSFFSVLYSQLRNKLLVNYSRNRGNGLATVRISLIYGAILSNYLLEKNMLLFPESMNVSGCFKITF